MKNYTAFAKVYDLFMEEVPYDEWAQLILSLLAKYGISPTAPEDSQDEDWQSYAGNSSEQNRWNQSGNSEYSSGADSSKLSDDEMDRKLLHIFAGSESGERVGLGNLRYTSQKGKKEPETDKPRIADLGCGTGAMTRILAAYGYAMTGIDLSADMLIEAQRISEEDGLTIRYLREDMSRLVLTQKQNAFVSVCDSVNYLITTQDLENLFSSVSRQLLPGGIFVFDFNTLHKYRDIIGDATIAEDRGDAAFIWDNVFREEDSINDCMLTLFLKDEKRSRRTADPLYQRFQEQHLQRGYLPEEVRAAAETAGLYFLEMLDTDTGGPVTKMTERVTMVIGDDEARKFTLLEEHTPEVIMLEDHEAD